MTTAKTGTVKLSDATNASLRKSIYDIEQYMWRGNLFGTAFRGLSLSAVLLVAALGLAITFGLMGVINMAHGEIIMVGAYSAYVTQNVFTKWFGASGGGFDSYFIAALVVSFVAAAGVGLILERGVIRFLYKRPLESLLATWGVSLVLQQIFRHIFGAANVQVSSPSWLSGSFVISDVLLAYNRIFVIGFAVFVVLAHLSAPHAHFARAANPRRDAKPRHGFRARRAHRSREHDDLRLRQRSRGHGRRVPLADRQRRSGPRPELHRGLLHGRRARRRGQPRRHRVRVAWASV